MKQQFRFLVAGLSLTGLLIYTATPASAQADRANFTVTLMSLSIAVTPGNIPLGEITAADTKVSGPRPEDPQPIRVALGGATVNWFVAITNTRQNGDTSNAVVWRADPTDAGQNKFKMCVIGGTPVTRTICLAGPTISAEVPDDKFPAVGKIEDLGVSLGTQEVNWEFTAPTTSENNNPQEFNVQFAAAVTGTGQSAVNRIFQNSLSTESTTSGATGPLPLP